ncbi:hypothetical protein GQR58_030703 [Nymphon striatum]|nr:hypothetical protein GQR58_030703 [Nymphon striatum]
MGCAVDLDPVVAGVQRQTVPFGDAFHIRNIADHIGGQRQRFGHFLSNQRLISRAKPGDYHPSGALLGLGSRRPGCGPGPCGRPCGKTPRAGRFGWRGKSARSSNPGRPGQARRRSLYPCHSFQLANALTAATVMADPPRRPFTIIDGTGKSCMSASLDSMAPTKPTGQPIIAAGRGQLGIRPGRAGMSRDVSTSSMRQGVRRSVPWSAKNGLRPRINGKSKFSRQIKRVRRFQGFAQVLGNAMTRCRHPARMGAQRCDQLTVCVGTDAAHLQIGAGRNIQQPIAKFLRKLRQSACLIRRQPPQWRADPYHQPIARSHGPQGARTPAIDLWMLRWCRVHGVISIAAIIEFRRVCHRPAACNAWNRSRKAASAVGLASSRKATRSSRPSTTGSAPVSASGQQAEESATDLPGSHSSVPWAPICTSASTRCCQPQVKRHIGMARGAVQIVVIICPRCALAPFRLQRNQRLVGRDRAEMDLAAVNVRVLIRRAPGSKKIVAQRLRQPVKRGQIVVNGPADLLSHQLRGGIIGAGNRIALRAQFGQNGIAGGQRIQTDRMGQIVFLSRVGRDHQRNALVRIV